MRSHTSTKRIQTQLQSQEPTPLNSNYIMVDENELDELITSIREIKEMAKDINQLLNEEEHKIDKITENVDGAEIQLKQASKEIKHIETKVNSSSCIIV